MSTTALGNIASCNKLIAKEINSKQTRVIFSDPLGVAGAIPPQGVFFVVPPSNPTAYTLGAGESVGAELQLVHNGGGNFANISAPDLHGAGVSISMAGGQSVKLIWGGPISGIGGGWYLIGRESTAVAANNVVNLPAIA